MTKQELGTKVDNINTAKVKGNKKFFSKRNIILLVIFIALSALGFTSNKDEVAVKKTVVDGISLEEMFESAYGNTEWEYIDSSNILVKGHCGLDGKQVEFVTKYSMLNSRVTFESLTFNGDIQSAEMVSSFLYKTKELASTNAK